MELTKKYPNTHPMAFSIMKRTEDKKVKTVGQVKRTFLIGSESKHFEKANKIIDYILSKYEMNRTDISTRNRQSRIVLARQHCMYFIFHFTNLTLVQIGNMFGGKDHSTVTHSRTVIQNYIDYNKKFKETHEYYRHQIEQIL